MAKLLLHNLYTIVIDIQTYFHQFFTWTRAHYCRSIFETWNIHKAMNFNWPSQRSTATFSNVRQCLCPLNMKLTSHDACWDTSSIATTTTQSVFIESVKHYFRSFRCVLLLSLEIKSQHAHSITSTLFVVRSKCIRKSRVAFFVIVRICCAFKMLNQK